jgi:splicing factor 3B subunit 2
MSDIEQILKEENAEFEYIDEFEKDKPKFYENFKNVFEYFVIPQKEKKEVYDEDEQEEQEMNYNEIEGEDNQLNGDHPVNDELDRATLKVSKKKRKLLNRMKISELKQLTDHPEVVEAWDVTAQDPILLVYLKSMKNTVPVPKHWAQKRKFLQNKRGVLKQPFKLPDFIEATGISKIRDNTGTDKKAMKLKMRERMQPKLGKMDIDYQVLHDAFFRHQTKPSLTIHGDVYYENREYESKMKIYKPGRITEKLRVALGIPENSPPPWIINMQRYGPPAAYPNLKIPGVNAPICDPTAEITPNLWTHPVQDQTPILVYDFSKNKNRDINHWGDLREVDEDEYSEELNEDVSVTDEETRPSVENLFSGMDMDLSSEKTSNTNYSSTQGTQQKGYLQLSSASSSEKTYNENGVPNPNENILFPKINENSFYSVLEQKSTNIKQNEIYGSSHSYVIQANESQKIIQEEIKNGTTAKIEEEIKPDLSNLIGKKKEKKMPTFKF